MEDLKIYGIYEAAYSIWNMMMDIAMTLFTTSPMDASGGALYETVHTLFTSIADISTLLCTLFFLYSVIKTIDVSPPEQVTERLKMEFVKFAVVVAVVLNLWTLLGGIMQITDGITSKFAAEDYHMEISGSLETVLTQLDDSFPEWEGITEIGTWFKSMKGYLGNYGLCFIGGLSTLIIVIGASISIISCGFQRIIKPLISIPFATVTVSMASGSPEEQRVAYNYVKSFIGLCLAGAMMVVCVNLGATLVSDLIAFNEDELDLTQAVIYISVQNMVSPIVIAGLVKCAEGILNRWF